MVDDKIAKDIKKQYSRYEEDLRLESAFGQLEKIRTQELLLRKMPNSQCKVVDIGGATGAYSFFLAMNGFETHLIDIIDKHIRIAEEKQKELDEGKLKSIQVGDARELPFKDYEFDVVLIHGPLYHLPDLADRNRVYSEAKRVLKKGGLLITVVINRFAGLNYGISSGMIFKDDFFKMVENEVKCGVRKDPPDWLNTFETAYFHMPDEIKKELMDAGFKNIHNYSVMGTAWIDPKLDENWQDINKRNRILEVARLFENAPELGPRIFSTANK